MTTKRRWWHMMLMVVLGLLMALPAAALAKGPPPDKGETSVLPNNLSVPAIFVPNPGTFGVTCPGGPTDPTGTPLTGFEVAGYYYVQGTHSWQAQCTTATAGTVTALVDWGDNLEGTALKSGTPIRVEVGLMDTAASGMMGYHVIKLEPSKSDKDSKYGTLATAQGTDPETYKATQLSFPYTYDTVGEDGSTVSVTDYVRVYDLNAKFSLYNQTTGTYVVPENTTMSAEINATGKVVYGYNWGIGGHGVKSLPAAGTYVLTFYAPNVTLTGGSNTVISDDGHTATLTFVVAPNNNAGGKGRTK